MDRWYKFTFHFSFSNSNYVLELFWSDKKNKNVLEIKTWPWYNWMSFSNCCIYIILHLHILLWHKKQLSWNLQKKYFEFLIFIIGKKWRCWDFLKLGCTKASIYLSRIHFIVILMLLSAWVSRYLLFLVLWQYFCTVHGFMH